MRAARNRGFSFPEAGLKTLDGFAEVAREALKPKHATIQLQSLLFPGFAPVGTQDLLEQFIEKMYPSSLSKPFSK